MWTDEQIATLKRLWADGYSASAIACQIGDKTRNAVIGKVHRLKLGPRRTRHKARPRPRRQGPAEPRRRLPRLPGRYVVLPQQPKRDRAAALTRSQMYAMLADAVRNTAALQS